MNILIPGGTGYIGSHTALSLIEAGHRVLVLDNLCNSSLESVRRVERISGLAVDFLQADIRDRAELDRFFADHPIDAVIHFAGLKAVGESVAQPLVLRQQCGWQFDALSGHGGCGCVSLGF